METVGGKLELKAKVVIDCTSEGYVAVQAGAPYRYGSERRIEPHTLAFTCDGVDWDELLAYVRLILKNLSIPMSPAVQQRRPVRFAKGRGCVGTRRNTRFCLHP